MVDTVEVVQVRAYGSVACLGRWRFFMVGREVSTGRIVQAWTFGEQGWRSYEHESREGFA